MKRNKVQDLRVSDFMSTDLVTATPDETLGDVLGKMKSNDIHELPVIERKKLVGVVTMRELMRRRNLPPTTKVSTVLEIPPGIGPETPLPEAAEKMISAGFRAIPVVKGKARGGTDGQAARLLGHRDGERRARGDHHVPGPHAVPRRPAGTGAALRGDRRARGRAEGHVRRDLRRDPEGDASDRAARAAANPHDPFPEVQAGGRPLEVPASGALHDVPSDLLRA